MQQSSISKFFQSSSAPKKTEGKVADRSVSIVGDSGVKKRVREEISLLDDDDDEPVKSHPRHESFSLKSKLHNILAEEQSTLKHSMDFRQAVFQDTFKSRFLEDFDDEDANHSDNKEEETKTTTKKITYTPLETQVVTIRKQYPDCLLMVECGYRMRFFGDDALKAAKVLGIYAHKDHNFMVASVPTYRTAYHCQRLLSTGLKVAIVRQTETAALRKGNTSSSRTFDRKVSGVFTHGTLIDEDDPAFEGLVTTFQKKPSASDDASEREDDNEIDGDAGDMVNSNSQEVSGGIITEDAWIATVYCQENNDHQITISIVAVNIRAHKLWICDLPGDGIYQGLIDYLDILKPIEVIHCDNIPFQMKNRLNERLENGSFSSMSFASSNQSHNEGYIKLIKQLSPRCFSQHKERFLGDNSLGTEWYADLSPFNQCCANGLYVYLKEFQMINAFIRPTLMITSNSSSSSSAELNASNEASTDNTEVLPETIQTTETSNQQAYVRTISRKINTERVGSSFALDGITIRDLEVFDTLANTNAKLRKTWKDLTSKSLPSSSSSSSFPMSKMRSLQQGLFGIIDNCYSVYGKRTLKNWLMHPLTQRENILQRQELIEWFLITTTTTSVSSSSSGVNNSNNISVKQKQLIVEIMQSCPDIEKLLTLLQYNRISFPKLVKLLQFSSRLQGFSSQTFHDLLIQNKTQDDENHWREEKNHFTLTPNQLPHQPELLSQWLQSTDWIEIGRLSHSFLKCLRSEQSNSSSSTEETMSPYFTADTEQQFPILQTLKQRKSRLEQDLDNELQALRRLLKKPSLQFTSFRSGTNSQIEHLLELSNQEIATTYKTIIPSTWIKVNTTKQVTRYHVPEVLRVQDELYKLRDETKIHCQEIWRQFIQKIIIALYPLLRQAIEILGQLDTILSLAIVASYPNYCKPSYPENATEMTIEEGRHPILEKSLELLTTFIGHCKHSNNSSQQTNTRFTSPSREQLRVIQLPTGADSLIPNDVHLSCESQPRHCQILTGPNMGGKSSFVRMVGLLVLLGQIGSFIPASSASLCIFENIFTRMGSEDDLSSGRSTFMCELIRMKKILSSITARSLVIIDELGRGTSTHDGQAIAQATLEYLIQRIGCCTMFITHFPQIASTMEKLHPVACFNSHLSYVERKQIIDITDEDKSEGKDKDEEQQEIIFLYKVVDEASTGSYGVNVARLAGISAPILQRAIVMSTWMTDISRHAVDHQPREV